MRSRIVEDNGVKGARLLIGLSLQVAQPSHEHVTGSPFQGCSMSLTTIRVPSKSCEGTVNSLRSVSNKGSHTGQQPFSTGEAAFVFVYVMFVEASKSNGLWQVGSNYRSLYCECEYTKSSRLHFACMSCFSDRNRPGYSQSLGSSGDGGGFSER